MNKKKIETQKKRMQEGEFPAEFKAKDKIKFQILMRSSGTRGARWHEIKFFHLFFRKQKKKLN